MMGPEQVTGHFGRTNEDNIPDDLKGDEQIVGKDMKSDEKALDPGDLCDSVTPPNQAATTEMEHDGVQIKQEPGDEEEDNSSFSRAGSPSPEQAQCLVMKYDPEFGMTDSVVVVNPEAPETNMQLEMSCANDEVDFSASVFYLPQDLEGQLEGAEGGNPRPRRTRKSSRKGALSRRIMPNSPARVYVCHDCGQEFKYSHHLTNHVDAIHKQLTKHACKMCAARFAWRNQLQRHIRAVHKAEEAAPDQCVGDVQDFTENIRPDFDAVADGGIDDNSAPPDLVPVTEDVLDNVVIKQEAADDYTDFPYAVAFPNGNEQTPTERPAGKNSGRKRRRKSKVKVEGSEPVPKKPRPFVCSECGQDFKYSHHLRCHVDAIHKRLTNYACSECDAKFAWRNQLQRHIVAVHKADTAPEKEAEKEPESEEKKKAAKKSIVHVCGECGQEFNWLSHLREHVSAIHKQLKNYACSLCDAKFSWRNQLMRHVKSHKEPSNAEGVEGAKKRKRRRRKRRKNGHQDDDSDNYDENVDCKFCGAHARAPDSAKASGDALPGSKVVSQRN